MRIAKTVQIVFFLISHLSATHATSYQFHKTTNADLLKVREPRVPATYDAGLGLAPRQDGNGGSCDRRAKCKKKNIRDPTDDRRCIRCPPLMKSDPTKTICIKDDDASEEDKKNQYKEKIKEKIKEKLKKFTENIKERLDKKKAEKTTEWEEKDKQRQNSRNQKKFRRMAVCSPAVAASIGTVAMLELADGGFSEDLFDSINNDMLEFWPRDAIEDDWLDKSLPDDESDITKEDYVQEFLAVGDAAAGNAKRSIDLNDDGVQAPSEDATKRNIFTTIANAFRALARAIAAAAARRAGGGGPIARATKFFSNGKQPNLKKPGESKLSRAEQKDKAKEISQNKNWKKCLRGEKPEK
jgi:hypothetical protein